MAVNRTILLPSIFVLTILALSSVPLQALAEPEALFKVTLIAPGNANITRRQWGQIIAVSMQQAGIDARIVFLGWGAVYDRVFTPAPENLGKTYDEGGWDIQLIGWTPGLYPLGGTFQIYYSKNLAPTGSNYYLYSDRTADSLIEQFMIAGYTRDGETAFKRWQEQIYDDLPVSQILYSQVVLPVNRVLDFGGWEWIFDNIGPVPQYLKGKDSVVLAATGELLDLLAPLSNSWYDTIVFAPAYGALYTPDSKGVAVPDLAESFTVSNDGRNFTYRLRRDVTWHDGVEFSADDVLFSVLGTLHPATASQQVGYYAGFIGEDVTFKWENGTITRLVIDLDPESPTSGQGWYRESAPVSPARRATVEAVDKYTVKFSIADFGGLGRPTGIFHPEGFDTYYIIPKHVLETVPFDQWKTHPFNKGTGEYVSNGQSFSGPIGTGPYRFVSYDSVKALVTLERFEDYWNKTALQSQGLFSVKNYFVRYIVEKDSAIAALKTGEVDILDQNYQMQKDYKAGILDFAKVFILKGAGRQEVGYNMRHPIIGTGVDTPLGRSDPSRAAEAARYVRTAFDHLIPREQIIESLLDGFGDPGITPAQPTQPFFNTALKPREYSLEKARELLAKAGYGKATEPVQIVPIQIGNLTEQVRVGDTVVSIPVGALAGVTPITITGIYRNPLTQLPYSGTTAILQVSSDSQNFTDIQVGSTDDAGRFFFIATPQERGTFYYRVFFPGLTYSDEFFGGPAGPLYDYSALPRVLPPSYSIETLRVDAVTWSDILSFVSRLAVKADIDGVNSRIADLRSQVASLTTGVYIAIAIAVVLGIVAIALGRRR